MEEKMAERIKTAIETEMAKYGIQEGGTIWVFRNGCYDCPFADDHCQIDCKRKFVQYIEPISIMAIVARIEDGRLVAYVEDSETAHTMEEYNKTFFTDRSEAVEYLVGMRESAEMELIKSITEKESGMVGHE